MLEDSGTLATSANIQYLCTLLHGEALRQFDTFFAQVGSANTTHINRTVLGLGIYFFQVGVFPNKTQVICHRMRNPHEFKVRHYAARPIDLSDYLDGFSGSKASDKIGETELN